MTDESRREFLETGARILLSASGVLGVGGLLHYLNYRSDSEPRVVFEVGSESEYPVGSRTLLRGIPALLVHDESGYHALHLTCPHLGCTVEDQPDGMVCPCHGSRFDEQGAVLRGPARESLRPLRVEVTENGNVRILLVWE